MSIRTISAMSACAPWIRALLLALFIAMPAASNAFHFPWDQGHDTTDWDDPNDDGPCEGSQCDPCSSTGSPVYIPTGHFVWTETDVSIAGQPALSLSRTYNSNDPRDGLFGRGWTTNCDAALLQYVGNEFDASNGVVQVSGYVLRSSDGKRYSFRRSAGGAITAPSGRYERVVAQANGDLRVFARGGSSRTYSSGGRLVAATSQAGHVLSFSYDTSGRLQRITNPAGRFISFTYNSRGRVDSVGDSANRTWRYAYDANGSLISITNPAGGIRRFEYRAYTPTGSGHTYYQLTRITDETGLIVTDVAYNGERVASYTEGENRFSYAYNTTTRTVTKTDSLSSQWVYTYTDAGKIASIRDPLGNTQRFEFDANGNATLYVDQMQNQWRWTYDEQGRILSGINPASEQRTFEYQANLPNPVRAVSPSGRVIAASFDASGNLTEYVDPAGARTSFSYDSGGNVDQIRNALTRATDFDADASGLQTAVRGPSGRAVTMSYDGAGRLVSLANALGGQKRIAYDEAFSLPSIVTEPSGLRTEFTRDAAGRVLSQMDAAGRSTTFEYDTFGRVAARVSADGLRHVFRYRSDNQLSQVTRPDGVIETYSYDAAKRMIGKSAGGDAFSYTYNARNDLLSATNAAGTLTLTYDAVGRLSGESFAGRATTYSYNAEGERSEVRSAAGVVRLIRDNRGLLTRIEAAEGNYDLAYDSLMRRTSLGFPNGSVTQYTYDAADQLLRMDSSGAYSQALSYQYDARGYLTSASSNQGSWAYDYDADGRLITAGGTHASLVYQYDAAGNLTSGGRTYDAANRLVSADGFTFTYDSNGNQLTRTNLSDGSRAVFGWNAWNQLISVRTFSGGATEPTEQVTYAYDALGRRISRVTSTLTERYVYDGLDRIGVVDASGAIVQRVTFGPHIDEPLSLGGAEGQRYLHANRSGSVIGISDTASTVGQYEYDPYGASLGTVPTVANPFRYTGREADEAGMYYYRARYYDPAHARFASVDPLGLAPGLNQYAYVYGNPLSWNDPTGEFAWVAAGAVIGAVVNVGISAVANGGLGNMSASQIAAAAVSGAISGAVGAVAGPLGGTIARGLGSASNGALAAVAAGGIAGAGGAAGQAAANAIDPCNASDPLNAALWAGVGGGLAKGLFPTRNLNTWSQASHFGPSTVGGLFGSGNAWLNLGSFGASAGVGGAANFPQANPF